MLSLSIGSILRKDILNVIIFTDIWMSSELECVYFIEDRYLNTFDELNNLEMEFDKEWHHMS